MSKEPGQTRRINWRAILGILVSGVFLYIAVRNLHLERVREEFRQAQYVWIAPAVALYLFALLTRTARWQALLSAQRRIAHRHLLPTMAMGRAAHNIYPFHTGEIIRVLLLRERNSVSASAGLASILVERVFDGLTMILFLILAAFIGGIPDYLRFVVWAAVGVFGAALMFIYAMVLWPEPIHRLVAGLIERLVPHRFHERLLGTAERFIGGFASVKSILVLTLAFLFSILLWSAETVAYRLIMNAFGFQVDLHHLLLMSGAANLGTALPAGPGHIGTFDAPAILVLTRVGVPQNTAISYQTLLHAVLWTTETLAGLLFMWRLGLTKADLDKSLETAMES